MTGILKAFAQGLITHRGIVNTPECDENGHMNVQFYWARFERADAQFRFLATQEGLETADIGRRSRHVRYHGELRGATSLHIVSQIVRLPGRDHSDAGAAPCKLAILHAAYETDRGTLAATALDRLGVAPERAEAIEAVGDFAEVPASAQPRSLAGALPVLTEPTTDARDQGAVETCRTTIDPQLVGIDGGLTDRGFVALSVEAAPATWSHGGFAQDILAAEGLGRVALEKRLVISRRPAAGALVHMLTRFIAVERSTFSVRHIYVDSRSGDVFAACDVTLLAMDLTRRKGVPLPAPVRARMHSLVAR
jgi:acyl-CoA thioester hydrolase